MVNPYEIIYLGKLIAYFTKLRCDNKRPQNYKYH